MRLRTPRPVIWIVWLIGEAWLLISVAEILAAAAVLAGWGWFLYRVFVRRGF